MNSKAATCMLVLVLVAVTQRAVIQDLKNRLLSATLPLYLALSVNFGIDRLAPHQTVSVTLQPPTTIPPYQKDRRDMVIIP